MPIVLAFGRSLDRQLKQEGTHRNVERNSNVDEHSLHNIDFLFDLALLRQNRYTGVFDSWYRAMKSRRN